MNDPTTPQGTPEGYLPALQEALTAWATAHADELAGAVPPYGSPHFRDFAVGWLQEALVPLVIDEGIKAVLLAYQRSHIPSPPDPPSRGFYVYRLWGQGGRLLYIGSSRHLSARLRQHRRDRGHLIVHVTWEEHDTEADMLAAEADAIHDEIPPLNFRDVG